MLSTGISSCLPFNPVSLCIVCRCNYVSTMEDKSLRTSAVHVHVVHPVVTHCNFLQIWTFLRTDTTHNKQQVLAIRPEGVPSLRPASVHYIQKAVRDANIGVKSDRKDFLEGIPEPGEVISKVHYLVYIDVCHTNYHRFLVYQWYILGKTQCFNTLPLIC